MTIILVSFLAGLLSVLAPCVLPMIPVMLWGWLVWDRRKPIRIIWSAMICIFVFTYLLKISSTFVDIPTSTRTWISWIIIWLYGLILIFPRLWDRVVVWFRKCREDLLGRPLNDMKTTLSQNNRNDAVAGGYHPPLQFSLWWDILLWASLWPIFATCSPTYALLLGSVLPVSTSLAVLWILAYMIGFGGFLYILVLGGRQIIKKFYKLSDSNGRFKKILWWILLILWIFIVTGYIKTIEANLISCISDSSAVEQGLIERFNINGLIESKTWSGNMEDLNEQLEVLDVAE